MKAKLGAQNKEGFLKAQQMELLAAADKEGGSSSFDNWDGYFCRACKVDA
jgi:hypothetical protein